MEKEVDLTGFVFDLGEPNDSAIVKNAKSAGKIDLGLEIKVLGLTKSGRNSGMDRE